ncbi:MAG: hypothetical protein IJA39_03800 [Clostridia bacterium]|nr:hypothetical protein [Clostridia bacterium]
MKKNVMRVLSLVLVASMLFAFASCSSKLNVHFVDGNGDDLNFQALVDAINNLGSNGGSSNAGTNDTPVVTPPPSQETPSQETPSQGGETTTPPASNDSTTAPQQSGGMPATTAEITAFYKKGVDEIKAGKVGYTKKEWQNVDEVNIGNSLVNGAVTSVLGSFMTVEADAQEQINAKGSDDAKNRIAAWTLTDLSKVKSATCVKDGSNYKITIIMHDEDTPKKQGSVLGQVTGALLYWEDIEKTLTEDPTVTKILTGFSGIHVIYKGYKIEAVMTPDGKFVSIDHTADVDIIIGEAKIIGIPLKDKSGHMWNYCKFYGFQY